MYTTTYVLSLQPHTYHKEAFEVKLVCEVNIFRYLLTRRAEGAYSGLYKDRDTRRGCERIQAD